VQAARRDGPQTVTKRGAPAVVVVAAEEFERLRKLDAKPRINFVEFLLSGPKSEEGIEIPPAEIRARDADL
jgi:prevent-host-death family protein